MMWVSHAQERRETEADITSSPPVCSAGCLLFVHGFVSGPSSCSVSIFACSATVDESRARLLVALKEEHPTLCHYPNEEEEEEYCVFN